MNPRLLVASTRQEGPSAVVRRTKLPRAPDPGLPGVPLPVLIGRVITPFIGVITPVNYLFIRPFIGFTTILITRGPPCVNTSQIFFWLQLDHHFGPFFSHERNPNTLPLLKKDEENNPSTLGFSPHLLSLYAGVS